jgi:hypothetical protein
VKTLVDLVSNERGYVRIYAEPEGYAYQLSTYSPSIVGDLFEQMSGYPTAGDACAAAHYQLSAIRQAKARRRKRR